MRVILINQPRALNMHALLHDLFHHSLIYSKGLKVKYENYVH
jgi:hypothetical protein